MEAPAAEEPASAPAFEAAEETAAPAKSASAEDPPAKSASAEDPPSPSHAHITDALSALEERYSSLEQDVENQKRKLQNVLDVNRALRRAISTKRHSIKEMEAKNADLMVRLSAKDIEANGRVEKLANVQQTSMHAQQTHKDNQARLNRTVKSAEQEVVALNKDNVLFAEEHVDLNHVLSDQETRLADLDRRIELSCQRIAGLCDALNKDSSDKLDYYNLPHLPLAKLLRQWKEEEEEKARKEKLKAAFPSASV
jgi:chromosome segregation ATPase